MPAKRHPNHPVLTLCGAVQLSLRTGSALIIVLSLDVVDGLEDDRRPAMSSNPFQTMQQITTVAGKLVIAINKVMDKPRVEEHTRNDLRAVRLMAIDIQKAVERAEDGKPIPGSTARLHLDALKDILQQVDTWLRKGEYRTLQHLETLQVACSYDNVYLTEAINSTSSLAVEGLPQAISSTLARQVIQEELNRSKCV